MIVNVNDIYGKVLMSSIAGHAEWLVMGFHLWGT